jgi:hypothetical protein
VCSLLWQVAAPNAQYEGSRAAFVAVLFCFSHSAALRSLGRSHVLFSHCHSRVFRGASRAERVRPVFNNENQDPVVAAVRNFVLGNTHHEGATALCNSGTLTN